MEWLKLNWYYVLTIIGILGATMFKVAKWLHGIFITTPINEIRAEVQEQAKAHDKKFEKIQTDIEGLSGTTSNIEGKIDTLIKLAKGGATT